MPNISILINSSFVSFWKVVLHRLLLKSHLNAIRNDFCIFSVSRLDFICKQTTTLLNLNTLESAEDYSDLIYIMFNYNKSFIGLKRKEMKLKAIQYWHIVVYSKIAGKYKRKYYQSTFFQAVYSIAVASPLNIYITFGCWYGWCCCSFPFHSFRKKATVISRHHSMDDVIY